MALDMTEEERLESVKKWLQKHGQKIIFGCSFIMLCYSMNYYWEWHQQKNRYRASVIYEQLMQASSNKNDDKMQHLAQQLINKYSNTAYADIAHLILAKLAVDQENYQAAKKELQAVIDHSSKKIIVDVARSRLTRILNFEKSLDNAGNK
jgi:predicted negative regulator of RcsB-dependent stress response